MLRLSLVAVLAVACSAGARSREYIIRGVVLDARSKSGVSSARVRVPAVGLEFIADTGGRFEITVRRPPGCYLLRVRMIGSGVQIGPCLSVARASLRLVTSSYARRPFPNGDSCFLRNACCRIPSRSAVRGARTLSASISDWIKGPLPADTRLKLAACVVEAW